MGVYWRYRMYCRNCGQELNENDRVCPACGTPVSNVKEEQKTYSYQETAQGAPHNGPQTYEYNSGKTSDHKTYNYSGPDYQPSEDSGSAGWGFLGCCFPLVGLILFLVWKDNKPRSAKSAGIGAIIGVVITIVLTLIFFALGIGVSMFGLAEGMANGEIDLSELGDYLGQNISTTVNTLNL